MVGRALILTVGLLAALSASAESYWGDELPSSLADCDGMVQRDAENIHSYSCYWYVARTRNLGPEAMRRLEGRLSLQPDNPRVQLYLGLLAADQGQPRAEGLFRRAAGGFADEQHARGEIWSRTSLARFLHARGRTPEADHELERARERASAYGDPALELEVLVALGWQRYYSRRYGDAWAVFRAAQTLADAGPPGNLQLETLDGLAATAWALGRITDARAYYRLELERGGGSDPYREAGIRRNIAFLAGELAAEGRIDRDEHRALCREALDATVRAGNRLAEPGIRLMLAPLLDGEQALEQGRRALAVARETGRLGDICWALYFLGERTHRLDPDRLEDALDLIEEGLAAAREYGDPEHLASGLLSRASMLWEAAERDRAIEASLEALDAIEAIRELQPGGQSRARVFGRFADEYRATAARFLDRRETLPTADDAASAFRVMERMRARSLLETLDAAGVTSARGAPRVEADDVRHALSADQALISFQIPGGWAMVIDPERVLAVELPAAENLRRRIRLFLSLLERRDGSARPGAVRLYADVLAPAVDLLPASTTRLVLIPDGPLHDLPFGVLTTAVGDPPLAQRFEITVVPSAATWLRWKKEQAPTAEAPLLALADPPVSAGPDLLAAEGLPPLPLARREVARMGKRLGPGSTVLVGQHATERVLRESDLRRFRMVHLAVHAVVNDEHPERSAVILSAGREDEDGLLSFREIVDLDLGGAVVLLSACRSGSGPIIGGEGVFGLANAFFQAGARAVVAGLWRLRDRETAALVDAFGRELARGHSVAGAMRLARIERIGRGAPAAAWGGMIALGDGDLVPFPVGARAGFPWSRTLVGVTVLLLVVASVLAWLGRR